MCYDGVSIKQKNTLLRTLKVFGEGRSAPSFTPDVDAEHFKGLFFVNDQNLRSARGGEVNFVSVNNPPKFSRAKAEVLD